MSRLGSVAYHALREALLALESLRWRGRTGRSSPRHIVVGATTLLGDLMMTAPLVGALKRQHPGARLTLMVRPEYVGLAALIRGCDAAIPHEKSARSLWRTRRLFDADPVDLGVVALDGVLVPVLRAVGAGMIRSYADPRGRYQPWIAESVAHPAAVSTLSGLLLRLAGGATREQPPYLRLPGRYAMPQRPYVVVHPGARKPPRLWSAERYRAIAAALLARGYDVVVTGSGSERPLAEEVLRDAEAPRSHNLAGRISLTEMVDVIGGARLFVGPDTGVAHMAKALGTKAVILLGPSQREVFGPDPQMYGNDFYAYVDGLACRDKHVLFGHAFPGVATCDRAQCLYAVPRCMTDISVEAVLQQVGRALGLVERGGEKRLTPAPPSPRRDG